MAGFLAQDRTAHPRGAARRPLERGDRAVPHRSMVRRCENAGAAGDRGGARAARRHSSRRTGKARTSTGWRTSSRGASRANSGGAIRSRRGTGRMEKCSSRSTKTRSSRTLSRITRKTARSLCRMAAISPPTRRAAPLLLCSISRATRTSSTPGSPLRSGRSRRSAGRTRRRKLARFYPTSTLVTGFDIIFFWVARMMMMGLHFMKEVPFKDIYIHRLVRDEKGAKMSKSKGNVVDPLGIIDDYGADALRFTLARGAAQGHDIRLSPQTVENNRNFATKLWNAARFVEFNGAARVAGFDPKTAKETLNRWIAHETAQGRARDHRGAGAAQVQRRGERGLSLRLERLLRLVRGAVEAVPDRPGRRGEGRDARHRRLGARRNPQAAASVHAVHHRGAVARHRRAGAEARAPAGAVRLAAARRPRRRQGRGRDRLGDRSGHRGALGARRDEHHGADPAGAGRRVARDQGAGRALEGIRAAARPRRRHFLRRCAAAGLGPAPGARRGGRHAAQGRDRLRGRTHTARP